MKEHDLVQADLSKELGGQSVVSEILSGNRELNKKQIKLNHYLKDLVSPPEFSFNTAFFAVFSSTTRAFPI
jgi:antitoxin component HigA of HigAB toxin-antitoxin module